jgi:hypothetical protein
MTPEQARNLFDKQELGIIHFTGGPYVSSFGSGKILLRGGKYVYEDDTYCDIEVETCSTWDFKIYAEVLI